MDMFYDPKELQKILKLVADKTDAEKRAANELLGLQLSNAQKLYDLQIDQIKKKKDFEERQNQVVNERLIKMGYDAAAVMAKASLQERLKAIDEEEKAALSGKRGGAVARVRKEYEAKRAAEKAFQKDIDKANAARAKEKAKLDRKQEEELYKRSKDHFDSLGNALFSSKRWEDAVKDLTETFMDQGMSEGDAKAAAEKKAQEHKEIAVREAAYQALANFAKQLEGTINDIGTAQGTIDTRLQGSGLQRLAGSYWKQMGQDVTRYVGMSPFVKQADVVNNLKTLVGKGIAFNIEQRAFLETISDRIADTFEATDATLLKLVRIQQADTTAARLGMESALTAFLNNMYETTEYMTDAASSIRSQLYEASALMGAAEGTAFEYQVQKWLGSLYSVGFSNAEGLAGALGKLAAGDVSGITEGGYGNLLIMAANRANLSIADILANGLDDSETNSLLQAMVEYLGDIYAETKGSKVVQQQFANVFGLTASDLKAAANLFGSTNTIGGNALQYGGMMKRLQDMASSMWTRIGTGEMMNNLYDNLKYATASTMANDPVLYAVYTVASMLDDTVGGISIPSIMTMGTGFDLETTVADLMRVGTVGAGLLGGIGTMLAGLGQNGTGSAMLRGFGINDSQLKVLTRGTGTGIAALTSGTTLSESGYIGNASASDVESKTIGDASESAQQQVEAVNDESNETKLSTVDEHILLIHSLLQDVIDGNSALHVEVGNMQAWKDVMDGGRI